jgi:hypothetical protein
MLANGDSGAIASFAESKPLTFSYTDVLEFPNSVTFVIAAFGILIE